jgi:hypothetical protein
VCVGEIPRETDRAGQLARNWPARVSDGSGPFKVKISMSPLSNPWPGNPKMIPDGQTETSAPFSPKCSYGATWTRTVVLKKPRSAEPPVRRTTWCPTESGLMIR